MKEVMLFPRASPRLQLHQRVLTKHPAEELHLTCVPFHSDGTYSLWTGSSFPQRMEPHLLNFITPYYYFFPSKSISVLFVLLDFSFFSYMEGYDLRACMHQ